MRARWLISICFTSLVLGACAHVKKKDYSELDIATASGCEKPSMQFDELRDEHARTVAANAMPIRVKPGTYTIGIECAQAHNADGACVDTQGNPELKVGSYDLVLNPKTRYAFSCDLEGKEYVIRMREEIR